jgi:hypothetical protein
MLNGVAGFVHKTVKNEKLILNLKFIRKLDNHVSLSRDRDDILGQRSVISTIKDCAWKIVR